MNHKLTSLMIMLLLVTTAVFPQFRSGNANLNGTSLYFEISGNGIPMVFIHGIFCDTRNWEKQVKFFSPKYEVICYDARGYGKSSIPDTLHPYFQYEDLKNLLDYLKIDKAIVIGHSMGGITAMDYAIHYPDRVIALVLAEGGSRSNDIWDPQSETFKELAVPWQKLAQEGTHAGQKAFFEIPMIQTSLKNQSAAEIIRKMTLESPGWKWQYANRQMSYNMDSLSIIKKLTMPVLLINGEYSPVLYFKAMSKYAEIFPHAKLVRLKGSSHYLNLENPDDFNKFIQDFLAESKL